MLRRSEDFGPACERLSTALAIFERLGARPYIERTRQALTELSR